MSIVVGTDGPDSLVGTVGDDLLVGRSGPDVLHGGAGSDTLDASLGSNTVIGGFNADLIHLGGGGNTVIIRANESRPLLDQLDTIFAWSRTDRLALSIGNPGAYYAEAEAADFASALALANSLLQGTTVCVAVAVGPDVFVFADEGHPTSTTAVTAIRLVDTSLREIGNRNFIYPPDVWPNQRIVLTDGNDDFFGQGRGNDTVIGGLGRDNFRDSPGVDRLEGGQGDDHISENTAGDTLVGGDGDDFLRVDYSLGSSIGQDPYVVRRVETSWLLGEGGNDVLVAWAEQSDALSVVIEGGDGNDTVGLSGDIGGSISGGEGQDTITLGRAITTTPVVTLGPGADVFSYGPSSREGITAIITDFQTGDGGDRISWGTDFHSRSMRLLQDGSDAVIQVDFDGKEGPEIFVDFIRLLNVSATDLTPANLGWYTVVVYVRPTSEVQPTTGADSLTAGADFREVRAGAGDDTIVAGSVETYLRGDEGNDLIRGGALFDNINGNMGDDTIYGGIGDDWVLGGKDQDRLYGGFGRDIINGNLGNDTLDAGDGNDTVRGGQGNDSITGGLGDDFISGDRGDDTLSGGFGADQFHGSQDAGVDIVLDFGDDDVVRLDAGTTFVLRQEAENVVLDMGGGHKMILVYVSIADLTPGWLIYD